MSERLLKIGDKVRIKDSASYHPGELVTVADVEDEYYAGNMVYYVKADGKSYGWWPDNDEIDFSSVITEGVTLTPEHAERVREALEALGWDRDDLGPLAAPEKPKRYGKADVEFPADDNYERALEALEATARRWDGKITF